jgi:hypothetical protein
LYKYAKKLKDGKAKKYKSLWVARNLKGLNRIAKIGYGHLCLREENHRFARITLYFILGYVRFI